MNPETLANELEREPFIPLRLTLSNGECVDIFDPGLAYIARMALYVLTPGHRHRTIMQDYRIIALRQIASVDLLEQAEGTGDGQT